MKKLETFVNEKLTITKSSGVPSLISILESKNKEEYTAQCKNLVEYLKYNSNLPVAEMEDSKNELKKLSRNYQNTGDVFLWVSDYIFYGTWNKMYSMQWSKLTNRVVNRINDRNGFNDFLCNQQEIMKSNGLFIITKNNELMKQIDYLMNQQKNIENF